MTVAKQLGRALAAHTAGTARRRERMMRPRLIGQAQMVVVLPPAASILEVALVENA